MDGQLVQTEYALCRQSTSYRLRNWRRTMQLAAQCSLLCRAKA